MHNIILFVKKIMGNYNNSNVKIGFFGAVCFSNFIFLEYFEISNKFINSITAIIALFILLTSNKNRALIFGFFVGIFWFYWISISFIYYELSFLVSVVVIFIATFFAILFLPIGLFKNIYLKMVYILLFGFIHPFGFNWFIPNLLFVDSYFGIKIWQFAFILLSIGLFITLSKKFKIYSILLLIFAIDFSAISYKDTSISKFPIKVKIISTKVPQSVKWKKELAIPLTQQNISYIDKAIQDKYDLIILPETVFPLPINILPSLMATLKSKSKQISIVAGGLKYENGLAYNSTYFFKDGFVQIFDKKYLVPFGEYIPLPDFLKNTINSLFFGDVVDFTGASKPSVFTIKGIKFINAICYEATRDEIYKYGPKHIIATSNNGWFYPSTEPILQKLIIKYMSKKYNTKVIHSINMSQGYIIGM